MRRLGAKFSFSAFSGWCQGVSFLRVTFFFVALKPKEIPAFWRVTQKDTPVEGNREDNHNSPGPPCFKNYSHVSYPLGPPVVPFYPFFGEGSPTKLDYRKKMGTLFLSWRSQSIFRGVGSRNQPSDTMKNAFTGPVRSHPKR